MDSSSPHILADEAPPIWDEERSETTWRPSRVSRSATARTLWSAFWCNLVLGVVKVVLGHLGYSTLLIIDGLISATVASHIATILVGIQLGLQVNATHKFTYGKGKVQFMLLLLLGGVLVIAAAITLGTTIKSFFAPIAITPSPVGVIIALVSVVANLVLLVYIKRITNNTFLPEVKRAAILQGFALASSLAVLQAVVLVGYDWGIAERVGRISLSLIIIWISILIIKSGLEGVMDQSTGAEIETLIADLTASVEGVLDVGWVRTRRIGQIIHIDLQVELDQHSTVRETDRLAGRIKALLADRMEQPEEVIHVLYCPV